MCSGMSESSCVLRLCHSSTGEGGAMIMTRNSRFGIAAVSATIVALVIAVPLRAAPPDKEVKVINTPAEAVPVAVQGTPLQPVQRTELVIFAAGESIKTQTLYSVPTGKRLVI